MPQETVILNDFRGSQIKRRTRIGKTGKASSRTTIEIKAEPLVHVFDEVSLGRGPSEAIRDVLEKQIKSISVQAKPSTIAKRKAAAKALARGEDWALKRYRPLRGERTPRQPGASDKKFNDSGTLAAGLFVRQNPMERSWTINVPANRLRGETEHLAEELVNLVPGMRDGRSLLFDRDVAGSIDSSIDLILHKAKNLNDIKRAKLDAARLNAARAVAGLVRAFAGI